MDNSLLKLIWIYWYDTFKTQKSTVRGSVRVVLMHTLAAVPIALCMHYLVVPLINRLLAYDAHRTPNLVKKYLSLNRTFHDSSWLRVGIDIVHTVWCAVLVLAFIPYTRMYQAYTWVCYYAYIGNMIATFMSTRKSMHKPLIRWFWNHAQGVTAFANTGYLTFDFVIFTWDYIGSHFAPPIFLLVWLFIVGLRLTVEDDRVNPLTTGFWFIMYSINSNIYSNFIYMLAFDPEVVYAMELPYMYIISTFLPTAAILFQFTMLLLCTRAYQLYMVKWLEREEHEGHKTAKVVQEPGTRNAGRSNR